MAVIAVDCDDTLSRTNETICRWHNSHYGTDLTIKDYKFFHYWRVRGWGDKKETQKKVHQFNCSPEWSTIPVNEAAIAATKALKEAGHTLVMITARMHTEAKATRDWIEQHFPDTFHELYFTSAFESRDAHASGDSKPAGISENGTREEHRLPYISMPMPKSAVCKTIGASMLIDDSLENAHEVHTNADIPVALYGDWEWNKTEINEVAAQSPKSYEQRIKDGEHEPTKPAQLPEGIIRTEKWQEVLALVEHMQLK